MARIEIAYQMKNPAYTRNRMCTPVGILVHTTDGQNPFAKRYVDAPELLGVNEYGNHWNKATADKCMHAFIGLDKDARVVVVQTLPYHKPCKGCGRGENGSYNYDPHAYLQFEICEGPDSDAAYYREAIQAAEEYCVHLCRLYGWTADNITCHVEAARKGYASDHDDPEVYMGVFDDGMDQFRARVAARMAKGEMTLATYEVLGNPLKLRTGPGTGYDVLAYMPKGTMVEVMPGEGSWLQVSYTDAKGNRAAGWASAKYLRKVAEDPQPEPTEPTDAEKLDILWAWYKQQGGDG